MRICRPVQHQTNHLSIKTNNLSSFHSKLNRAVCKQSDSLPCAIRYQFRFGSARAESAHRVHTTDKHPNPSFIVANMIAKPRSSPSLVASLLDRLCAIAQRTALFIYIYLLFKKIKHNNRINREIVELLINFGCGCRRRRCTMSILLMLSIWAGGDATRLSRVEIKYENG